MANTGGNKPRSGSVEAALQKGRGKGFGGPDGLGPYDEVPYTQDKNSRPLKANSGDVKPGWRRGDDVGGGGGIAGVTDRPGFDNSAARRSNAKPISTGGSDTQKSPFSAASKATDAESDNEWLHPPTRNYKGKA